MRLKELRKNKGVSQEQIANALGITFRAYQNYEYGQREIVKGYLELPEDMRDGLMDFLEKAVAKVQAESKAEAEKAPTTPVEQSEPEVMEVAVAARSFGKNENPPGKQKLKKRPGAGSILDAPDYKAD